MRKKLREANCPNQVPRTRVVRVPVKSQQTVDDYHVVEVTENRCVSVEGYRIDTIEGKMQSRIHTHAHKHHIYNPAFPLVHKVIPFCGKEFLEPKSITLWMIG